MFKLEKSTSKIVIIPSISDDDPVIYESPEHSIWSGGTLVKRCGCPPIGDENKIEQLSIALYVKAKKLDDSNPDKKRIQELASSCKPKINAYANVVDATNVSSGVLPCRLPVSVTEFYYSQYDELEDGDDYLTDPSEIKVIKVVHNGKKGLLKKYKSVAFLNKKIDLTETFSEDELVASCTDLKKQFEVKFVESEYEAFYKYVKKLADKYLNGDDDDEDEIDYEQEEDEIDYEQEEDELDEDLDDDELDEDLDDDELDEDLDEDNIDDLKDEMKVLIKEFKSSKDKSRKKEIKKLVGELKVKIADLE